MLYRVQHSCPRTGATPALQPHELGLQAWGVVSEKLTRFGSAEKTAAAVVTEAVMPPRSALANHSSLSSTRLPWGERGDATHAQIGTHSRSAAPRTRHRPGR